MKAPGDGLLLTLIDGLRLPMVAVREESWVPGLRKLAKKTIKSCWACKRFQAVAQAIPPPGSLPKERIEGSSAFEIVSVDFAGPLKYRRGQRCEIVCFGGGPEGQELPFYLADEGISWSFNLSRGPWWGGQFERLVGSGRRGLLTWEELCDVVLDVEIQLSRRPLSYVEEDAQLALLTAASFLFQRSNQFPKQQPCREEDVDLRKRARYLMACKDAL
ncbi:uncharacterized protein [Montipora foliosa]|uniref:uncharacterized protein n=1 Tax=Montipora foliosa TaxID=591990 RepID=UPI0035F12346